MGRILVSNILVRVATSGIAEEREEPFGSEAADGEGAAADRNRGDRDHGDTDGMRASGRGRRRRPCWRTWTDDCGDGWPGPAGISLRAAERTGPTARLQRERRLGQRTVWLPWRGYNGHRGRGLPGAVDGGDGGVHRDRGAPASGVGSGVRRPSGSCMAGTRRCSRTGTLDRPVDAVVCLHVGTRRG